MNYLKQKNELILSVVKDVDEYISKLSPLIAQNMPLKLSELNNFKNAIAKELGEGDESLTDMDFFVKMEKVRAYIQAMNTILRDAHYAKHSYGSDMSDTYKAETHRMYKKLSLKFAKIFAKISDLDKKIHNEISVSIIDEIKKSTSKEESFQKFRKMFLENPEIVDLYTTVFKKLIEYEKDNDRDFMYRLLSILEEDKTHVLDRGHPIVKKKILKNPILKSFGLIPNGVFMTPEEISVKIFSQNMKKDIFKKLAEKNKMCVIVLNKITYLPVASSIESLIDRGQVDKFFQPPEVGVTKNIVSRFSTIDFLEKGRGWNFSSDVFGDMEAEKILLLETFNGKKYRNLNIWTTSKYVLEKNRLTDFLEYLKKYRSSKFYPSRCDNYNSILSNKILKNIYFPKQVSINILTDESTEINARYLRNTMTSQMVDLFIKKEKKIKDNVYLGQLIKSELFSNLFEKILIEYYEQYSSRKMMKNHSFPKSSVLVDFLFQLNELSKQFKKEMQANFNEINLEDDSYKYSQKIFEDVLSKTLSVIIVDKKNLYQAMLFKDKLLSI